jgi:Dolichyl-phosphate-mannose-protein mannosyltransferase
MLEAPARGVSPTSEEATPPRGIRVLAVLIAVLLAAAAVLLVAVSLLSYATVKHRLDRFASDHDANFSRSRYEHVVWQLRALAAVVGAAAVAVRLYRRRLEDAAGALLQSAAADVSAAASAMRRTVAAESRVHLGSLAAIVVVGALVRIDFLFQPMRYDEAVTYIHYASRPLYVGLTTYTAPNNHLLNTALVHVATALLGNHPWAIRLPAFLAGVLLVPATYLAARALYGSRSAVLAAAFVATSSTLIEYSTNARGYMGVTLVFVLLLALGVHLLETRSPAAWSLFAVLAALGLYTIPTMLYALGAIVVWLALSLVTGRDPQLLRTRLAPALLGAALLTLVLYAPVLAASGVHSLVGNSFVTPRSWSYFADHLPSSLGGTFGRWHRDQPLPLWALTTLGFLVGTAFHRRLGRTALSPVIGAIVFIPPVLVAQHVVPFERVWLFLLPLYFMTAAAGLLYLGRRLELRSRRAAAAVALIAAGLAVGLAGEAVASRAVSHSEDTSTFRDAPQVAAFLARNVKPGDRVLVSPPADAILEYYLDARGLDAGRLLYTGFTARRMFVVVKQGRRDYTLPEVIHQHLEPAVARRLRPVLQRRYPHARVYVLLWKHGS